MRAHEGPRAGSTPGTRLTPEPEDPGSGIVHDEVWKERGRELSLLELASSLLRHRRAVAGLTLGTALLSIAIGLLFPRTYTTSASFLPEQSEPQLSQLADLASQFGATIPIMDAGRSPEFYAEFLQSRYMLRATVEQEYVLQGDPEEEPLRGNLLDLYDVRDGDPAERLDEGIELLAEKVSVATRTQTGTVDLSVTAPGAELSRLIVERMLELLNDFNLNTRQSQATAERRFIEGRIAEAQAELGAAEEGLKVFLQRNRSYANSPALQFEFDRLERQVTLKQGVVLSLAQSYEQARMDEVRNTPVITVVEPAQTPLLADSRNLGFRAIVGLVLGALLGLLWAFGADFLGTGAITGEEEVQEFRRLVSETREGLLRAVSRVVPWRRRRV